VVIPRKGMEYLLQAFQVVRKNHPEVHLDIVGKIVDPDYHRSLLDYVKREKMTENVRWLGPMDRAGLAAKYASSTLLALASLQETTPVVIAEAMAVGCPVVATNVGGVADMVKDSVTGYVVEPMDTDGLASAISKVLDDKLLRTGFEAEAVKIARERYAPEAVASKTADVYRRVLESHQDVQ
ncbi:MAG TPA: glycosyltransferase, partial [Armatimonadota bacterium]|nr:glycosyltransferase [Armatimonadota bacterium]